MSKKLRELEIQLADLSEERTKLDEAVEQMIGNMAEVPPEQRASSGWAENGVLTQQYLGASNRLADLDSEIHEISRAIAEIKGAPLPN
jgi:hypothetical protein